MSFLQPKDTPGRSFHANYPDSVPFTTSRHFSLEIKSVLS
jgi:hypothetical protein